MRGYLSTHDHSDALSVLLSHENNGRYVDIWELNADDLQEAVILVTTIFQAMGFVVTDTGGPGSSYIRW